MLCGRPNAMNQSLRVSMYDWIQCIGLCAIQFDILALPSTQHNTNNSTQDTSELHTYNQSKFVAYPPTVSQHQKCIDHSRACTHLSVSDVCRLKN